MSSLAVEAEERQTPAQSWAARARLGPAHSEEEGLELMARYSKNYENARHWVLAVPEPAATGPALLDTVVGIEGLHVCVPQCALRLDHPVWSPSHHAVEEQGRHHARIFDSDGPG